MKPLLILGLLLGSLAPLTAEGVQKEGHTPGAFTMDYDAALAYAKAKDLPILLDFTGSDWCSWCQLMQKSVFTQADWKKWAPGQMVLVTLDFPNDPKIVPEKYKARNQDLSHKFEIRGYPTYVILDSDGQTELGRLGAGQGKTPGSFIAEIKGVTWKAQSQLKALEAQLSGSSQKEFQDILKQAQGLKKEIADWKTRQPEKQLESLEAKLAGIRLAHALQKMTPEERKTYDTLFAEKQKVTQELQTWLSTDPEESSENNRIYQGFQSRLAAAQDKLQDLTAKYLP